MGGVDKEAIRARTDFNAFWLRELGKLGPPKPNGDCMAPCPLHDEHKPSFAANIETGSFYCFGCGARGDIFRFIELRYDLSFADAIAYVDSNGSDRPAPRPTRRQAQTKEPTKKKSELPEAPIDPLNPSHVYPYYDPDGRLLYYVFRWDKPGHEKAVRPGHYTETGDLVLKMPPGVKRTLYNLHRVAEYKDARGHMIRKLEKDEQGNAIWPPQGQKVNLSVSASSVVYLVEGEKCANALLSLGLCATTSGSANTWRPELAELLRGKTVIIIPDADGPGEKYAQDAAKSLIGVADSVRILRLDGLAPGEDVADWIAAKGGI